MRFLEKIRQNQRTIKNLHSVKEALDNLPNAIGYYDSYGMLKLYNRRMSALYYMLANEELQDLAEFKRRLAHLSERDGVKCMPESPNHYLFPDDTVWKYSEARIDMGEDIFYTEIIFSEVTQLYQKQEELKAQAIELEKIALKLSRLSENVLLLTKEEEVLEAKTRLHDEMGAALVAARQGLVHSNQPDIAASAIEMFKKAVKAIKNDNEYEARRGSLAELTEDAETIGMRLEVEGRLPGNSREDEVFISAIREGMTNAVRHAGADLLSIRMRDRRITITNNGQAPVGEIVPRGGLLNLKHRAEALGATMALQSVPKFELTIRLPDCGESDGKEG